MRAFRQKIRDERGVTAIFVALSLAMFFGAAALAVDLGMLATARAEAQNAADGAALAAAAAFAYGVNVEDDARALAAEYARRNSIRGQPAQLVASDIEVRGDTVRVSVRRTASRGNAIPTLFARVFGDYDADISAQAAAAPLAGPARVPCLLPITIPDRWVNFLTPPWGPVEGDFYEPVYDRDGLPNPRYVGYGAPGERLVIQQQPPRIQFGLGLPVMEPAGSFVWLPGDLRGPREVRARVDGCPDGAALGFQRGQWLRWEDQNRNATIREIADGLEQVIDDPRYSGQYYDDQCLCVRDRNRNDELVTGGPRYRAMPVMDPSTMRWWSFAENFQITHFVGVFVERVTGPRRDPRIHVRVVPLVGTAPADQQAGPLVRIVRLVE